MKLHWQFCVLGLKLEVKRSSLAGKRGWYSSEMADDRPDNPQVTCISMPALTAREEGGEGKRFKVSVPAQAVPVCGPTPSASSSSRSRAQAQVQVQQKLCTVPAQSTAQ